MHDEFPEYHSFMAEYRAQQRRHRILGLTLLVIAAAGAVLFYRLNF